MNRTIYKVGDAVEAYKTKEINVLLHCCNGQGVMNSGIAKQIRQEFPDAFDMYKAQGYRLGTVSRAEGIFNMVAQEYYGYDGRKYVNYGALANCLKAVDGTLKDYMSHYAPFKIGIPYKMASDRAGGDWKVVIELVEWFLKDHQIVVYKLEEED